MSTRRDCSTCRHHAKQYEPKPVDGDARVFDELVAFEDDDAVVYFCRAPGAAPQRIGREPIHCDLYEAPAQASNELKARLDALEARLAARARDDDKRR